MANREKIIFNKGAAEKLRKDPKVAADLLRRAKRVAAAAGGEEMGYKVTELVLEESRSAVSVMATGKAHFDNKKHQSLLRALNAGR